MTERGLPIVDGAHACPFVAFEDDRDERAASPDHRHRCYAELRPAPRALAHQEAYCLSSAFAVCPTFQDWARREAASTRHEPAPGRRAPLVPGRAYLDDDGDPARPSDDGGGGPARDPGETWAGAAVIPPASGEPGASERNPRRAWSSPPPWLTHPDSARRGAPDVDRDQAPSGAGGLAGSVADRFASHGGTDRDVAPAGSGPNPRQPGWTEDGWDAARGDPAASREPDSHERAANVSARPPVAQPPSAPPTTPRRRDRADAEHKLDPPPPPTGGERYRDLDAPSWERPRRLEAYPSLRSRRLPSLGLPPLLLALVAVVLAALLLFFLPSLLGIGSTAPLTSASPSASSGSAGPSLSVAPTIAAAPTPIVYTVQAGDTMSKIANRFGVTLAALVDANKATIKDPNKLKIGDMVIIPTTQATALPGASAASSP